MSISSPIHDQNMVVSRGDLKFHRHHRHRPLVSMEALAVDLIIDIVKSAVGVKKEWEAAALIGSPQSPSWCDGGHVGFGECHEDLP
jgi:hypothetical protein